MPAIVVKELRKSYGDFQAVNGISFVVEEGEVFALLGPNGAGKTTTVEILEGHRRRTAGDVSVLGFDPEASSRAFRERVGVVLQESGLDAEITVAEALRLFAHAYPDPLPVDEVIELVGLINKQRARVKTLSGGQRRRLDLALGVVGNPDLIFLDEPTTGFDPSARRKAWVMLDDLRSLGKTILLTTHYLDEVQHLADRVVVLSSGVVIAEGTPDQLGDRHVGEATVRFLIPAGRSIIDLPSEVRTVATVDGRAVTLLTDDPTRVMYVLTGWALGCGEQLEALSLSRPSLEDAYLQLTEEDTSKERTSDGS